jgi:hypothetical protein
MRNTARQTRDNRTITVDFQHEATYCQLLGDGKAFVEFILAFLLSLGFPRHCQLIDEPIQPPHDVAYSSRNHGSS